MPWVRIDKSLSPEEEQALRASPDWLGPGLLAVIGAGFLALLTTWFVVLYSSLPDEFVIQAGLIGFFFVLFFDLFVIGLFGSAKIRQGQRRAAIQLSVRWVLVGFPVALAVGALPWLMERLIQAWPWLLDLLSLAGTALIVVGFVRVLWVLRARKASP
jgi:hypothetical protein